MAWYSDGAVCDYFPNLNSAPLRAIGWLERGHSFTAGTVPEAVYRRLTELFRDPWEPVGCAGFHDCDLCVFQAENHAGRNLFVPGEGCVYVCPELILHYINAHGYAPPAEFCAAVLACPDPHSMEYKKALLKGGLKMDRPSTV